MILWSAASALAAAQDVSAPQRRIQDDLTTQRAVAIARERRLADERELALLGALDDRDAQLRKAVRAVQTGREAQAATRAQLDAVIAERGTLVDAIAKRDRAYAAEVAEFRRQVAGLAATPDPQLQQALQQFADGDRVAAFPVIERLLRAENAAAERATAIRSAEKLRNLGALALVMLDRGEKKTADVIPLWEEAQRLDGSYSTGWVHRGASTRTSAGSIAAETLRSER